MPAPINTSHPVYVQHLANYDALRSDVAPYIQYAADLMRLGKRDELKAWLAVDPLMRRIVKDALKLRRIIGEFIEDEFAA